MPGLQQELIWGTQGILMYTTTHITVSIPEMKKLRLREGSLCQAPAE